MDTSNIASSAVPLLVAAVTGAGSAIGTGRVQAVSELIRERLGDSEHGRAALAELDRSPADPVVTERLHAALLEAFDADPAFTRRLVALLDAPPPPAVPPAPVGSVVIGDSNRLRGSNISLGPLTISTTRGGPGVVLAAIVLFLGMVVLAVYGGVQVLDRDDSPDRGAVRCRGRVPL